MNKFRFVREGEFWFTQKYEQDGWIIVTGSGAANASDGLALFDKVCAGTLGPHREVLEEREVAA